jgi:hypothetical protein
MASVPAHQPGSSRRWQVGSKILLFFIEPLVCACAHRLIYKVFACEAHSLQCGACNNEHSLQCGACNNEGTACSTRVQGTYFGFLDKKVPKPGNATFPQDNFRNIDRPLVGGSHQRHRGRAAFTCVLNSWAILDPSCPAAVQFRLVQLKNGTWSKAILGT